MSGHHFVYRHALSIIYAVKCYVYILTPLQVVTNVKYIKWNRIAKGIATSDDKCFLDKKNRKKTTTTKWTIKDNLVIKTLDLWQEGGCLNVSANRPTDYRFQTSCLTVLTLCLETYHQTKLRPNLRATYFTYLTL